MQSRQKISKKPPDNPSLHFERLKREGIELIQELSGEIWTDFNLHDPGVTTLEVLCYALTELGYRAGLLNDAFEAEMDVAPEFIDTYFFRQEELIPSLPVTRQDFEGFIEENHDSVLCAWFEEYPLLHPAGTIRGGYEIAVLLEPDNRHGNLNTDTVQIPLGKDGTMLEVNFFDKENRRLKWQHIRKVVSCSLDHGAEEPFFEFETNNCQLAIALEVVYRRKSRSERILANARVTLTPPSKSDTRSRSIKSREKAIIKTLETPDFLDVLANNLSKENHKARLLEDIRQTLLPCRMLCEDFISLRVVNEQEVKIDLEVILDDYAPSADTMIQKVYDRLDAFLMQLIRQDKEPEHRSRNNLLYASNFIEELVKIEGIEAAGIRNLNLFIDGIPTIPIKEEAAFECIHLQRFSHYVPKISRDKSSVTFIRSGAEEKADPELTTRGFNPQLFFAKSSAEEDILETEKEIPDLLDKEFFESLREYYSIRNEFPQNYRLSSGGLSENTPEHLKIRVRQFKDFLAFFERILIHYLEKLYSFNDRLSVRQELDTGSDTLTRLKEELPDLNVSLSTPGLEGDHERQLEQRNKILDHLLARFAAHYTPVRGDDPDNGLMRTIHDKITLLKDIPLITRDRGLGLPIRTGQKKIWKSDLLSGFQKRVYRLLGVKNDSLEHIRLTRSRGNEPSGFYLVEHILLAEREEDHIFVKRLNRDSEVLFEFFSQHSGGKQPFEPYSFQLTLVLPEWIPAWSERKNRVETIIGKELPAHILPHFLWLNKKDMKEFEVLYEDWLTALLEHYQP